MNWSTNDLDQEPLLRGHLFGPDRINVDHQLWVRQKTELAMLRFLVIVQLMGIAVLAVAVGYLMFSWY